MNIFKAARYARSESLADDNNKRTEVASRYLDFSETAVVGQALAFHLEMTGMLTNSQDINMLVDKVTSYGRWCQLRNTAAKGIVPGKKISLGHLFTF